MRLRLLVKTRTVNTYHKPNPNPNRFKPDRQNLNHVQLYVSLTSARRDLLLSAIDRLLLLAHVYGTVYLLRHSKHFVRN